MRRSSLYLCALLTVSCAKADQTTQTPDNPADVATTATGVSLEPVLLPDPGNPLLAMRAWFQVGSQDDPAGKEGLAFVTANLLTEGATADHTYPEIQKLLYPMAAGYRASVDREMTTISGRIHADNLEAYLKLLTAVWSKPAFDEADFERVRSDALNYVEKSLRYASDEELGKATLYSVAFAGTPYAHPSVGTVEGLKSLTVDDVKNFYATHYTADRLVFGLAGGFEDRIVDRLEGTREQLAATGAPRVAAPDPKMPQGKHVTLVQKEGADASISFGFPIDVHRGDRDYYALWIANSWLGEHRNSTSHLYQVIRATRGLNYGDYSYIEAFPNGGRRNTPPTGVARRGQLFQVWIRTLPNNHAHFALRAAVREVQELADGGMTAEEFELTRMFLKKYVLHFADTPSARLGYALDDRFYGLEGSHLETFRKMMDEITLEEVNAALKRHIQVDNMHIAIVSGEAKSLAKAITSEAPSTVTYASEKPADVLEEDKKIHAYKLGVPEGNVTIIPVEDMLQR